MIRPIPKSLRVFFARIAAFLGFLLAPLAAFAQTIGEPRPGGRALLDFVQLVLSLVTGIAAPFSGFLLVYSGFLFVTAQGDESKLVTAKKYLAWSLIVAALVLGLWALVELIVNSFRGLPVKNLFVS